QTIGDEQFPRPHDEIVLAPSQASIRRDLNPPMASRQKDDCCFRVFGCERKHTLDNTRTGWNIIDFLGLGP
ncbi:MAG: hypothetical protein ACERKU_10080, partial [Nitrospirota bacterium]